MTPQAFGYESFTPHDLMLIVLTMFCTDVLSTWADSAASGGGGTWDAEPGGQQRGSVSALGLAAWRNTNAGDFPQRLTESVESLGTSALLPSTRGRARPSTLPVQLAIDASTQPSPLCRVFRVSVLCWSLSSQPSQREDSEAGAERVWSGLRRWG